MKSMTSAPAQLMAKAPQQQNVKQNGDAKPPCDRFVVIWQELELEEYKKCNREDHESDQSDKAKHEPRAHLMRSGEVLHKDVAWQLAAKARTRILIRDLRLEFGVKNTNLAG